jgi:hypothetical protein
MKSRNWIFLFIGFLILLSGSCQNDDFLLSHSLDRLNWSENNWLVLNQLIADYGTDGKYYNRNRPPYAVLDWDQTCAHFDSEEALMRYQLLHFRFKMTKAQFEGLLKDEINGIEQLSEDFDGISLKDLNADLISDYDFLYDNFSGLNGTMSLEQIRMTPQYNDFVVKTAFLYNGYCGTPGIGAVYGYPWVLYLFAGHTTDEIRSMAKEAISYELANNLSKQTWLSPANLQTNAGVVSYSFKTGLRVFPEMLNLISMFSLYLAALSPLWKCSQVSGLLGTTYHRRKWLPWNWIPPVTGKSCLNIKTNGS